MSLVLFAGLQNIPGDLIEAARLDGARAPALLFRIILPLLRPVIAVALVVRGIDAAKAFDIILIQTNGGPAAASETMSLLIYRTMVRFGEPGLASAMGTIYLMAMLAVAVRRRHHHLAARKGHLMSTLQRPTIPARQIAKAPSPAGGGRRRRGVNREGLEAGKRSTGPCCGSCSLRR